MTAKDLDRIHFVASHFNDLQGLRFFVPLGLILLSFGGTTYFENRLLVILRAGMFLAGALLLLGAGRYYRNRFGAVEPDQAGDLDALSVYSPGGSISRLQGFELLTPGARFLAITLGLTFTVFFVAQAIAPTVRVDEDESLVHPPWTTLDSVFLFQEPWTVGIQDILHKPVPGTSTTKAVTGQLLYALCGALLLGTWFWRGRRGSQGYHLALGTLLLGLSAFGTCLGYFVWEDRALPVQVINLVLPAAVHLWLALLLCGSSLILAGLLDHRQLVRMLGGSAVAEAER